MWTVWKMVEILNLFVLGPLCVCRFLYALFKKVWLGGGKKGCQVVCSCCGWAQQSLQETGKNTLRTREYAQLRKSSAVQTKNLRDIARKESLPWEPFKKEIQQLSGAIKRLTAKGRHSSCRGRGRKKEGS